MELEFPGLSSGRPQVGDPGRRPIHGAGLIQRSDRVGQYLSISYSERLAKAGIEPLVSAFVARADGASSAAVGDSYDNALGGSVIGLYETELIGRLGPWKSLQQVDLATLDWVDRFNTRWLLGPIP